MSDIYKVSEVAISIHALLAESDFIFSCYYNTRIISIHALLAESDNINSSVNTADKISIHALLAESDSMMPLMGAILILFLSTLSLRRATK